MKKYLLQMIEQNNAQIKVYMEYCANFLRWNLSDEYELYSNDLQELKNETELLKQLMLKEK